jgi:uncharacterized protein YggU (UPF0235/DUF167 family)
LTPSSGADCIDALARDTSGEVYLKARVCAAPEKGKANAALEALIAKAFGVAKSKVAVARGTTTRLKTVEIDGASDAEIAAFVARYAEKT